VISSVGSSSVRKVAAEEGGVCYIGMGEEGGEPMPLRCTSIYLIIIQIFHLFSFSIYLITIFLSYCILDLVECQAAGVE
jgi:hypothetical protein